MNKIPFLWSEALLRDGPYMAFLYTPLTDLLAVSSYINSSIPRLASKLELGFVKPADSQFFTIPHHMYQDGKWRFNLSQMAKALRKESVVPLQK